MSPDKNFSKEFIPIASPTIGDEEAQAVFKQVQSGWISMGARVKEFEQLVCGYTGAKHAVAMVNGTATLHAGLLAMGVGPGDEVVVPTLSYVSSANAVLYCGATPVFCEVDPGTFNATPEIASGVMTENTKVIMPVDLKGQPADFDGFMKLGQSLGVSILADSAESFGSIYNGCATGRQCDAHSFSFFANKNLTMGEGGIVTTNNDKIAEQCAMIRNQGQSERYVHVLLGHNYRITDYAAAIGISQLARVESIMTRKSEIAEIYSHAFSDHPLITVPKIASFSTRPSWYMYCLTLDESVDQRNFLAILDKEYVDWRLSFPPIHLQPYYQDRFNYKTGDYPVSEAAYSKFVDIPCFADMHSDQINRVIGVVKKAAEDSVL